MYYRQMAYMQCEHEECCVHYVLCNNLGNKQCQALNKTKMMCCGIS